MRIREARAFGEASLAEAGIEAARLDAELLLSGVMGKGRLELLLENGELTRAQQTLYEERIRRRSLREPLQYIEGETEFMGFPFSVTPAVLIPRADTECLVEAAIERLPAGGTVFDLGTGSGAIAVSIARMRPDAKVSAGDISPEALAVAKGNAQKNGVNVSFVLGNCLEPVKHLQYDIIVSNPPYIAEEERSMLSPEVLREPALALFDGGDGLRFYREITREAGACLKPGGTLLFEIGWQQADAVSALLEEMIGEPFRIRDYGGNWRVVGAARRQNKD